MDKAGEKTRDTEVVTELRQTKAQVLSWFGVLGLAITIVGSLDPLLQLAGIAHYLVEHWHILAQWFWAKIFVLFGIRLNFIQVAALSTATFCWSLLIGIVWSRGGFTGDETSMMLRRCLHFVVVMTTAILVLSSAANRGRERIIENLNTDRGMPQFGYSMFEPIVAVGLLALVTACSAIVIVDNQRVVTRRLVDVAVVVASILALDFIHSHAGVIRSAIENILKT